MSQDEIILLANVEEFRVGCVLLQAVAGCNRHLVYDLGFEVSTWQVSPSDKLRRVSGTRAEWEQFAKLCNDRHQRKRK